MNEDKKINEDKALPDETLEGVAGGAGAPSLQAAKCSVCHEIVMVQATYLPSFGRCPKCQKEAYFSEIGYNFS